MMGVPANYLFMAQAPGFADADLSSLRRAVVGGAPMPVRAARPVGRARRRHRPGLRAHRGGAERALPAARGRRAQGRLGGQAVPVRRVRLSRRGRAARPRAERLRRLLAEPGGDRGRVPRRLAAHRRHRRAGRRGLLPDPGRLKELVISGGENVYPAEIENVLDAHPRSSRRRWSASPTSAGARSCAAFVVLADGRPRTSCSRTAATRLARFKVPKTFHLVEALPRNSIGKIQKSELAVPRTVRHDRRHHRHVDGRPLSRRGLDTRRKLLDAAEEVFGELGYHDASIVKITEAAGVAQGTFYLYFASKQEIFDELVRRPQPARAACDEGGVSTRGEPDRGGAAGLPGVLPRSRREHPALYRIIRQAEFVSPEMLRYHYDRLSRGLRRGAARSGRHGRDRRRSIPR